MGDLHCGVGCLVALGEPTRLEPTLRSALRSPQWCSVAPSASSPTRVARAEVNLAACHACVLLPETSCEHNNGLLDRALLIGTRENPIDGFFHEALK